MTHEKKVFVDRIKKALQENDMTKTDLANELNISIQSLVNYLSDYSNTIVIEYKLEKWLLRHLKS